MDIDQSIEFAQIKRHEFHTDFIDCSLRRIVGCEYHQSVVMNIFNKINCIILKMVVRVKTQQTMTIVEFMKSAGLQ